MRGIETSITHRSGLVAQRLLEGLDAVAGLGDDLHVGLAVDQQLHAATDDAVVVGDQDPHVRSHGEFDGRALAGRGEDVQAAADEQRALAHAGDAEARAAVGAADCEAAAVVAHAQDGAADATTARRRTALAPACWTTLDSALLRDAVEHELLLVGQLGQRRRGGGRSTRMPVRSPKSATCEASAGTRPWSSSAVGRSWRASVSSSSIAWVASVWISLSSERSPGGTSSAAACRRSRIAVSAWLTSSCRSCAMRARSSSWARMTARPASTALLLEAGEHAVEVGGQALDLARRASGGRAARWPGRGEVDALHRLEQAVERGEPARAAAASSAARR